MINTIQDTEEILEKNVQEIVDTCRQLQAKYPELETEWHWCHVPYNPDFTTPFGRGAKGYWGSFTVEQEGFKRADEKVIYPDEDDLVKLLGGSLVVDGIKEFEDNKWLYLAKRCLR